MTAPSCNGAGAVELRSQLATEFALELPATVTFDHPTAAALTAHIVAALADSITSFNLLPGRLSLAGSELSSWSSEDSGRGGAAHVAGVSGRWPGSDSGVAGFWDAWRTEKDLPQVSAPNWL